MSIQHFTLQQIVETLNSTDNDRGLWLPLIQRKFIWDTQQIYRFYDSIMREYPFGTLLVWKTNSEQMRYRKFIDTYRENIKINDFCVQPNANKKSIVLDGQQRLQSLLIGLKGSYDGKELYFNIFSGDKKPSEDIQYEFKFGKAAGVDDKENLWIKFSDIVFPVKSPREVRKSIIKSCEHDVSEKQSDKIEDNLHRIHHAFSRADGISYQEIDTVDDQSHKYDEDDVVEIFIRANDGGTPLSKSDLLFSLLSATWDDANEKIGTLTNSLKNKGFNFHRDFILKTCLVLLDKSARYNVKKFRQAGVLEKIEQNWNEISKSIFDVIDFIMMNTHIKNIKALPSSMVLIPLIYSRFKFPEKWKEDPKINDYIIRSQLVKAFSGKPDGLIDECVKHIKIDKGFIVDHMFDVMRGQARPLTVREDTFWSMGYGSNNIHLIFNLWYINFSYNPLSQSNYPQVDHIFPQSRLSDVKHKNTDTGKMVQRYNSNVRNQLANCMLLSQEDNSKKRDMLPSEWFNDKGKDYLELHCIPTDKNLWELDQFIDFIEARKALIKKKFIEMKIIDVNPD